MLTCALQPPPAAAAAAALSKMAIPGLKLTPADTKDRSAVVGKGTVIAKQSTATPSSEKLQSSENSDHSESEEEESSATTLVRSYLPLLSGFAMGELMTFLAGSYSRPKA